MALPICRQSRIVLGSYVAIAALAAVAVAPAQAAPAGTAAPGAVSLSPNPSDFVSTALRIAVAVEQGQSAAIWDNSSTVMKTIAGRDQFVNTLRQKILANGALRGFTWRSVMRVQLPQQQGQLPAGQYLTVNFVGINKGNQPVAETISFILDGDQKWRLVGLTFG